MIISVTVKSPKSHRTTKLSLKSQMMQKIYLLTQTVDWFIWINASNLVGNRWIHSLFLGLLLPCWSFLFLLGLTSEAIDKQKHITTAQLFLWKNSIGCGIPR